VRLGAGERRCGAGVLTPVAFRRVPRRHLITPYDLPWHISTSMDDCWCKFGRRSWSCISYAGYSAESFRSFALARRVPERSGHGSTTPRQGDVPEISFAVFRCGQYHAPS
jgi:hypothetical protein